MAFDWNVFRILADVSHTLSKCILIWAIHSNKSAEGVSLITQIFYLVVFCFRYLFQTWGLSGLGYLPAGAPTFHLLWNSILKIFYMVSSAYIIYIMMRVFARTRERERSWKIGTISLVGSAVLAPFVMMIFKRKEYWTFSEFTWDFSLILESVCVLPQLLLLRQTTVPTVIDSFYLVTLGSYRGFYLLNWMIRAIREQHYDPVSVIFGLIQTALYVDFAWVYWTRQRVKLRGGSVVDSEDLSKGWLVKRLVGNRASEDDGDEETAPPINRYGNGVTDTRPQPKSARSWGARGISVSADVGVHEAEEGHLAEPDEFEDEASDRAESPAPKKAGGDGNVVPHASEWADEGNTRR